jgi:hypothetical protein
LGGISLTAYTPAFFANLFSNLNNFPNGYSTPGELLNSMHFGQVRIGVRNLGSPLVPKLTVNTLQQAVLAVTGAISPALAVPLTSLLGSDDGLFHVQIFFVDSSGNLENVGYFGGAGVTSDPGFPGNIDQYQFSAPLNTTPQQVSGFTPGDYNLFTHNCQDYTMCSLGGGH